MKTILVVVGEDSLSQEVLQKAIEISVRFKAKMLVLHTIHIPFLDIPSYNHEVPLDKNRIKESIESKVEALRGSQMVDYYTLVYFGDPVQRAIVEAKREQVDLIITSPNIKLEKLLLEVQKNTLLIHGVSKHYHDILIPTDLSDLSKEAIKHTQRLFPQSHIRLVYGYESIVLRSSIYDISYEEMVGYHEENREIALKRMSQFQEELGLEGELIDTTLSIYESLVAYIKEKNPDLVVVASGSSESFNFGSVSTYIAKMASCDVWVYCASQS